MVEQADHEIEVPETLEAPERVNRWMLDK